MTTKQACREANDIPIWVARWAIVSGKIDRPPVLGSTFNWQPCHVEQLRLVTANYKPHCTKKARSSAGKIKLA
jgi:hypothetical protein